MGEDGKNSTYTKNTNRGLVLELLATGRAASRIALVEATGLSKMSVTNIVGDFIEAGLVRSGGEEARTGAGRKPRRLAMAADGPGVLGLYIARDRLHGILCDLALRVDAHQSVPLAGETRASLGEKLTALCGALLADARRPVWAIGAVAIGPVDAGRGTILNPPDFFGIEQFHLAALLGERFGLPVVVENDMNAAALAEMYFGAGRGFDSFLYVGLANGVGSGVVSGRRLYQSAGGLAGELGHTGVDLHGPLCPCGRQGCLELYASIPVLVEKLQAATGRTAAFEQYCAMDAALCDPALLPAAEALAYALTSQVNMLDPQAVLLGHEGAFLPRRHIDAIARQVNRDKLWGGHSHTVFDVSFFGSMSPVFGAVCAVLCRWFGGELPAALGDGANS